MKIAKWTLLSIVFLSMPCFANEKVTIGVSPSLTATLTIIAQQQGYFARQGIDVDIRVVKSGSLAVAMMLNDEIDISESSIFALVSNSFKRKDFGIYTQASISGNDNMIVGRKDRGIHTLTDLKGKRIGVDRGAYPSYVLDIMLMNAGISPHSVTLVSEQNDKLLSGLVSGGLDAVCFYGGWVDKATKELGDNAIRFHDEQLIRVTIVHAAKTKELMGRSTMFQKILAADIQAEDYVKANPDAALRAVVAYLQLDLKTAQSIWKPQLFHLGLEQSLVIDLENLAHWQMESGLQPQAKIPNFLEFIAFGNLTAVDSRRVSMIH